jgi:hypothetical protein
MPGEPEGRGDRGWGALGGCAFADISTTSHAPGFKTFVTMLAAARRALGEGESDHARLTNRSPLAFRIDPGLAFISGRTRPKRERRRDVPPKPALLPTRGGGRPAGNIAIVAFYN